MTDMINKPPHYIDASGVECIDVTRHMGFCGGNCFKYLYRAGKKGDMAQDLRKAKKYAEWANEDCETVPDRVLEGILRVADHRDGGVRKAMFEMCFVFASPWQKLKHVLGFTTNCWTNVISAIDELL